LRVPVRFATSIVAHLPRRYTQVDVTAYVI
jgi:hypothetical protein